MTVVRTDLGNTKESAHRLRFEPVTGNPSTNVQEAIAALTQSTVGKNIVTDYGAVGDGVTNNNLPFLNFQSDAQASATPVILTIPPGTYHITSADAAGWYQGISDLTVYAYGATVDKFGSDWPIVQQAPLGSFSWRLNSSPAIGSGNVTLNLANSGITFAAANLQATANQPSSGTGFNFCLSNNFQTTGKFYFEATYNAAGSASKQVAIGFSTSYGPVTASPSNLNTANSFMVFDDGNIWQNFSAGGGGSQVGSLGASFVATNVIGCAIDLANNLGWFRIGAGNWNGSSSANPATGIGGIALGTSKHPLVGHNIFACLFLGSPPGSVTCNFGGSGYANAAPSGFGNWGGTLNTNFPLNVSVNDWVCLSSIDLGGKNSIPQAWHQFEFQQVSSVGTISGSTVQINLQGKTRFAYLTTSPDTRTTNQFYDTGGPASLFKLSPGGNPVNNSNQPWNTNTKIFGLTIQNGGNQIIIAARDFTFVDCTFDDEIAPSQSRHLSFTHCDFNGFPTCAEIDKIIEDIELNNCSFDFTTLITTSSTAMLTAKDCRFNTLQEAAKQAIFRNCIIQNLQTAIAVYGQTVTRTYEDCYIAQFTETTNSQSLALSDATYATGTFSVALTNPNIDNYWTFAQPGAVAYYSNGGVNNAGAPLVITGATISGGNLNINTTVSTPTFSGFGVAPSQINLHYGPQVVFKNCIGDPKVVSLSAAPDQLPMRGYVYFELDATNIGNIPSFNVWGFLVKLRVNVIKAYTGVSGTLLLHVFSSSGRTIETVSGNTWTQVTAGIDTSIDLKVAGERVITQNTVGGLTTNDTDVHNSKPIAPFGQTWIGSSGGMSPSLSANITGETQDLWPIVQVELFLDQSVGTLSSRGALDVSLIKAATNRTVASPTTPNSTSAFVMQGLAGAITPTTTGTIQITISGTITTTSTAAGNGVVYQLSFGTGAAPTSNAALTGTQVGLSQQYLIPATVTAADVQIPFSIQAVVTGLNINTAYWIDLAAKSVGTVSTTGFSNVNISAVEI